MCDQGTKRNQEFILEVVVHAWVGCKCSFVVSAVTSLYCSWERNEKHNAAVRIACSGIAEVFQLEETGYALGWKMYS